MLQKFEKSSDSKREWKVLIDRDNMLTDHSLWGFFFPSALIVMLISTFWRQLAFTSSLEDDQGIFHFDILF